MESVCLGIAITQRCDMKCAHCCMRSGPDCDDTVMTPEKFATYVNQFAEIPAQKSEFVTITGGEPMLAYINPNTRKYMSQYNDAICDAGMVPAIKTNALWGLNRTVRSRILRHLSADALHNNKVVSIDISIDQFHRNEIAAVNIISDIATNNLFGYALRPSVCGLNTVESDIAFNKFLMRLESRGFDVNKLADEDTYILSSRNMPQPHIYPLFVAWGSLQSLGRAADNNLGDGVPTGAPDSDNTDCMLIKYDETAILNWKYSTTIQKGEHLADVYQRLQAQKQTDLQR